MRHGAEQDKILELESRQKAASPQYATGDFCPLSAAAVESNLDHTSICLTLHCLKRKSNASE